MLWSACLSNRALRFLSNKNGFQVELDHPAVSAGELSAAHHLQCRFRKALSLHLDFCKACGDFRQIVLRQLEVDSAQVLLQPV